MFEFNATVRVRNTNGNGATIGVAAFGASREEAAELVIASQARMGFEVLSLDAQR